MHNLQIYYHPNHVRALQKSEYDVDEFNVGWTGFFNTHKKDPGCRKCHSSLIKNLEKYIGGKKYMNLKPIAHCKKTVLTVGSNQPINYLNQILKDYMELFGQYNEIHGKFGGGGYDGSRILLFYENKEAQLRKKELEWMVEKGIEGDVKIVRACDWMHGFVNIDSKLKSEVRRPFDFLQELKNF